MGVTLAVDASVGVWLEVAVADAKVGELVAVVKEAVAVTGFVTVIVMVPSGVTVMIFGVFEGRGLLVVVAVRLGVKDGSAVGCVVIVDVGMETALASDVGCLFPLK
ncbi:MAG: hypothetical protein IPL71_00095 [Anaerolineales bacterium]|uniref:hypothetical protein n=1 Tax=Candidatus Villigracilis proximus TaxID=3140683 RepID=UPI003136B691|nr:hypothetical protein [Anaerolineales bacterium]